MTRISIINPHEPHFDRMSKIFIMPRYGTIAIATGLKNAGYETRVFSEFIKADIDWDYVYRSDYICFGLMTFCSRRGYQLSRQIRARTDVPIIFGGAHPTVLPEESLNYCDYVVRNEGDATILQLLETLQNGADLSRVAGISYRAADGKIVHNPKREFIHDIDIPVDASLLHDYDTVGTRHFGRHGARHYMQVVQTSRGCPFNCKFCVAPRELGTRYRTKSAHTLLRDIDNSMTVTGSHLFMIVDNEFTVNRKRTARMLQAIIDTHGDTLEIMLFARTEIGRQPELLELMKRAGVKLLFLGIESTNADTLQYYEKKVTLEEIAENVSRIHDSGISTMGSTILGSDYDTPASISESYRFFIQNNFNHAHFYALYEIPTKHKKLGLPQLFPDNRFIHHDWRFYNSGFVVHFPKHMKPSTLQKIIIRNYDNFYTQSRRNDEDPLRGSVYGRLAFKLKMVNPEMEVAKRYIPFLEEFEAGYYDPDENLIEAKLPQNPDTYPYVRKVPLDLSGMA